MNRISPFFLTISAAKKVKLTDGKNNTKNNEFTDKNTELIAVFLIKSNKGSRGTVMNPLKNRVTSNYVYSPFKFNVYSVFSPFICT